MTVIVIYEDGQGVLKLLLARIQRCDRLEYTRGSAVVDPVSCDTIGLTLGADAAPCVTVNYRLQEVRTLWQLQTL